MPNYAWFLFETLINLIEAGGSVYFAWVLFKGNSGVPFLNKQSILCIIANTLWLSLYTLFDIPYIPDITGTIVILFLYLCSTLKAKWPLALGWSLINTAILGIFALGIPNLCAVILNVPFSRFFQYDTVRLLSVSLTHILWPCLMLAITKIVKPSPDFHFLKNGKLLFMSLPLFSILLLFVLLSYSLSDTNSTQSPLLSVIISVGLLFINFGAFYVFDQMSKQAKEAIALQAQNQLDSMAEQHQQELQQLTKEVRRFRHDFSNHVQTMSGLISTASYNELQAYLAGLSAEISSFSEYITTGNAVLDALLNAKMSIAKEKGIAVTTSITAALDIPLSNQHLCIVIGNLFNNACEACLKIPDEAKRNIAITIRYEQIALMISIVNPTDGSERKSGHQFLTTKPDAKKHGYGLGSIDLILRQYNGYCVREHKNNVFATTLILPMKELNAA